MPKKPRKSVRSFALLVAATALTTVAAGLTAPARADAAGAAPAHATVRTGPPSERLPTGRQLKTALLDERDLPSGYEEFGDPLTLTVDFPTGGEFCDSLTAMAAPTRTTEAQLAAATFTRGEGQVVMEMLAATGAREARANVAGLAAAPKKCPVIHHGVPGDPVSTVSRFRVPRLGDAAAGIRLETADPATRSRTPSVTIMVAHRGVLLMISATGGNARDRADLSKVVANAERKLRHLR